ncbi:MAG: hypothetical protein QM532_02640 [Cyanobium sp. MAG06]|nr:hypothetical protein [Cyanobium sp. MAG06]
MKVDNKTKVKVKQYKINRESKCISDVFVVRESNIKSRSKSKIDDKLISANMKIYKIKSAQDGISKNKSSSLLRIINRSRKS